MSRGDTYTVPLDTPSESEGGHAGHVVTVLDVRKFPRSTGPDPDDGGPDRVSVECSCGDRWSFDDRGTE